MFEWILIFETDKIEYILAEQMFLKFESMWDLTLGCNSDIGKPVDSNTVAEHFPHHPKV